MAGKHYDIFISYRREGGKNYARVIKPELEKRGLNVFLDFDELKDGKFDQRILDAIDDAPIFMLILSNGCLDRCVNDDDWVRQEILYADRGGKHIVPVEVDRSFRQMPDQVPDEVKHIVGQHQFSQVDTETLLQASMDELVRYRVRPYIAVVMPEPDGAEIHIEADADCAILRFQKEIGRALAGDDTVIRLKKGKHKLDFVSLQLASVRQSAVVEVPDNDYSDFVEVRLQSRIDAILQAEREKKEAEERRQREAEEQKRREEEERRRREEEERRRQEEERRRKVEEAERKKREEKDKKQKEIYICYSRKNHETVMAIKQQIESAAGTECWIDARDMPPNTHDFASVIANAIRSSKVVLFMLSKESQTSEWAQRECYYAKNIGKRVVLVNIDGCKLTDLFRFIYATNQIINWSNQEQRDKLIRDLRSIVSDKTSGDTITIC